VNYENRLQKYCKPWNHQKWCVLSVR